MPNVPLDLVCSDSAEQARHRGVLARVTETAPLAPLLRLLSGEVAVLTHMAGASWLDWICGYLMYVAPAMAHKRDLRQLLARQPSFGATAKGSTE